MSWTRRQQLEALLRLPWTLRVERDEDEGIFAARVEQIPSAIATGRTERELAKDLFDSLRASLEAYLTYGDRPPLPPGVARLPWEPDPREMATAHVTVREGERATWNPSGDATGLSVPAEEVRTGA